MGTTSIIAVCTGLVFPFITPLLYKAVWPEWVKLLIIWALAAVVGALELFILGEFEDLTTETIVEHLAVIYGTSAPVFWILIDRTGLKPWLEAHGVH